jgi:uncharacterized membrane protein
MSERVKLLLSDFYQLKDTMFALAVLKYFFLWAHLFSAMLFIGGSFFMWLVVVPWSKEAIKDEAMRTVLLAKISKKFARLTWMLLSTLIITGIINALWYLPEGTATGNAGAYLTVAMVLSTAILIILLYGPGRYYGRQIAKYGRAGDLEKLAIVRKKSTIISYTNLAIMLFITVIATLM